MKKIFALALVLLLATAASSFANSSAPTATEAGKSLYGGIAAAPTGSTDGTLIGKMSKGVYTGWTCSANGYILTTQHMSGNRTFGSSHDATAIFRNDSTSTDASSATAIDASFFGTGGWTAM